MKTNQEVEPNRKPQKIRPYLLARWAVSGLVIMMLLLGGTVSGLCIAQNRLPASGDDPFDEAAVEALIANLGNDDFLLRQKSTEQLLALGPQAIGLLENAADTFDNEMKVRITALLKALREKELQQRATRFVAADVNSQDDFGFNDWPLFANVVGRGENARNLLVKIYTEMEEPLRLPGSFLKKTKRPTRGQRAADSAFFEQRMLNTVVAYCGEMFRRLNETAPTVSPKAATDDDVALVQHFSGSQFERFFLRRLSVAKVRQSDFEDEFRSLLSAWLKHELTSSPLTLRKIKIINAYQLESCGDALVSVVRSPGHLHRIEALEALSNLFQRLDATIGGPDSLDASGRNVAVGVLEPFVHSTQRLISLPQVSAKGPVSVTLGAIAFQLILALEKKKPADFGMQVCNGTMPLGGGSIYSFEKPSGASSAIEQWSIGRSDQEKTKAETNEGD